MRASAEVLVVEDDDDIREVIAQVLDVAGYTVALAENGSVALAYLRRTDRPPCLILLDLMMPTMNGHELLDALRGEGLLPSLHVVVMTAAPHGPISDVRRVLRKPVDLDVLMQLAVSYCGHH
jgi:CheY-like chemotaxis protein